MAEAQEFYLERHKSPSKKTEGRGEMKEGKEGIGEAKCERRSLLKSSFNINAQQRHSSILYGLGGI